MVRLVVFTVLIVAAYSMRCHAMDRYYCAVDDDQLKMSVETGFKEQPGWPLNHLRAVVVFKPEDAAVQSKTLTGTLMLGASDIVQYWRDGQRMMIRTASKSGKGPMATDVDVLVETRVANKDINRFAGSYTITVRPSGNADPSLEVVRQGPIRCSRF